MTFVFDHMIAILVGATLLAGLFMLQVRGQQTAIEAAQRYRVQTQTAGFAQTVERDVENIRTKAQAEEAFDDDYGSYRFTLRQAPGGDYTEQATFVTLKDPRLGADSPAIVVSYTAEPTGQTVDVGGVARPTYRVIRKTGERGDTVLQPDGGGEGLLDFDLTALMNDGSELTNRGGTRHPTSGVFNNEVPSLPRAVRVEIVGATDAVKQRAADQANTSETNASRQTRTVALAAYGASGGLPPVDTSRPAMMPPLPGDPSPPPPPPTTTGGGGDDDGSDDDDDDGRATPRLGTPTTDGPPPRPTPGREI